MKYPIVYKPKNFWLKIRARLSPVQVAIDCKNFKECMPIYLAYCKRHRIYYLDYPHGYDEYFVCPLCLKEMKE